MSLEFVETKIHKSLVKKYLEQKLNRKINVLEYKRLGTGWHGTGYKIVFEANGKKEAFVLRTKRPEGFSHDYPADRAASFLIQHCLSSMLPKHNESFDVIGVAKKKKKKLVSIGECNEFFHLARFAEGDSYMEELYKIKDSLCLNRTDLYKAGSLSDYLASIHSKKFLYTSKDKDKNALAKSMYKRHLRDCIGHGEMLLGVLDTYPDNLEWTGREEFAKICSLANSLREGLKDSYKRLSLVHGDFHPGNILFKGINFELLDASRELYGEPADDLTALGINYIWLSVMERGSFNGSFKALFEKFWNNYLKQTKDYEINSFAPLFFAFRSVVVAHPLFYKGQSNDCRRKMFNFAVNVLEDKEFNPKKINSYLQ
jgi:thiamine kinase-like enzyme